MEGLNSDIMQLIGQEVQCVRQRAKYAEVVGQMSGVFSSVVEFGHQNWNEFYALSDYDDDCFLECWDGLPKQRTMFGMGA